MPPQNPNDRRPHPRVVASAQARFDAEFAAGTGVLPSLDELLAGIQFADRSLESDIRTWARALLGHKEIALRARLALLLGTIGATIAAIDHVRLQLLDSGELGNPAAEADRLDGVVRCDLYLVCLRDDDARARLISAILTRQDLTWRPHRLAMAAGVSQLRRYRATGYPPLGAHQIFQNGQKVLQEAATWLRSEERVRIARDDAYADDADGLSAEDAQDAVTAMLEDRGEIVTAPRSLERLRKPVAAGVMVVPAAPLLGRNRDRWSTFSTIAGQILPLIGRGDVVRHRLALQARFPHATAPIAAVLRDLATTDVARIRPTLFLGSPGCGKTSLARAIADTLGLPSVVYSAGGMADSSLMGTSAQWATARASVPLDVVRTGRVANPLVVLDELDKTSQDRRNGSLVDALLGFLEPTTSSRYRDLLLEVEVNLSAVNWIATANDIDGVPAPLRDRFRVVEVPDPSWTHLGDLAASILNDIATERGLDRRWLEDLAQDELDVIMSGWPGGSLRRLRRAIEVLLDGRDQIMGRA